MKSVVDLILRADSRRDDLGEIARDFAMAVGEMERRGWSQDEIRDSHVVKLFLLHLNKLVDVRDREGVAEARVMAATARAFS